jgi:hypothetical protein
MLIQAVRVYVAMLADSGKIGHGHLEHSSNLPRRGCGGSTSTKSFLTSFSTSLHQNFASSAEFALFSLVPCLLWSVINSKRCFILADASCYIYWTSMTF